MTTGLIVSYIDVPGLTAVLPDRESGTVSTRPYAFEKLTES